jgi:hypothetical protein
VLQIASITTAGNLNNPVPVPPGFVAGQINVSINLNPNAEKMDSVVVMVNGKGAGTQTFTSAQAAALRSAANAAGADQALQSTLVFSINTAAYALATGAVTYPNGPAAISVVGYGHVNGTAATNTSSQGVNLLFGNADAWIVGQTIGTTKVANNAAGFAYTTGSVAVTAIPVLYSGGAISTASVQFGSGACDNSGVGARILPLVAPAAGSFAWTATFPDASQTSTANAVGTVNDYEYNSGCASNAGGGEGAFVSASQYTTTNSGPAGTGSFALGSGAPVVRLDNRAPVGLALVPNAGTRTNSWFNDAVILNGTTAASPANGIVTAPTDNGVGGTVLTATVGGNVVTSTASLAESATSTAYTVSETAVDALGNTSKAVTESFGVDRTAPILTFVTQPGNNKAFAADPFTGFSFAATDNTTTAGAAPSGFFNLAATPLVESEAARNSVGTTWWCPTGVGVGVYQKSTVACANWIGATTTFASNLNSLDNGVGNNYFTTSATVSDQAGNVSAPASNLFAVDAVAPVIGGISFPPFFTAGGPATFTSAITTTGLDIALSRMNLGYAALTFTGGAAAPSTFWQPDVVVDAYNAAVLQTSAPFSVTVPQALTNIQVAGAGGANPAAVGSPLTSVNAFALNQVPTSSAVSTSAITGASLPTPTAITNTGAAGFGPVNFLICATGNGAGAACANPPAVPAASVVLLSKSGAGGLATSVSMTAVAEGLTSVFNNPYSAVQFWAYDPTAGANLGWRLIATVTNSSTVTDGGLAVPSGRNWQFSTVWTPGATTAPETATTVYTIVAIGIAGTNLPAAQQGMALATPVGTVTVSVAP